MQPERDDLRLLGEFGLLAAGRGMRQEALTIAAAMAAWRPDSSVAGIIRGLEALGRGRGDEAVRHLRDEALAAEPHSGEAQALLGFALEQAGYRQAADAVLEPLIERGGDGADLARAVLAARRGPPEIRR